MKNKDIAKILSLVATDSGVQNGIILPGLNILITSYKGTEGYRQILVRNQMFGRQLAQAIFSDPKYNISAYQIKLVERITDKLEFADLPLPGQHLKIFVKTFSQGLIEHSSSVLRIVEKDTIKYFQIKTGLNLPMVYGAFVENLYGDPLGIVVDKHPDRLDVMPLDLISEVLFEYGDYQDTYAFRCPYCGEILTPDLVTYGKCAFCGEILPQTLYKEKTQLKSKEEIIIEKIIENLNYNPALTYLGKNFWEIEKSGISILFQLDKDSSSLVVYTRLASLQELKKAGHHELRKKIYDFLLKENSGLKYMFFSLNNDNIIFSTIYFYLEHITQEKLTDYVREFIAKALDYNFQLRNMITTPASHQSDTHF